MTVGELHEILDDENKKISFKEYQEVLYQLKDETIGLSTAEQFEYQELTKKYHFYEGETNAFQIALNLSEHINQNQKAIECLREIFNTFEPYEDDDGNVIFEKNGVSFIEYYFDIIKELKNE